jgi:hypothetical protein
LAGSEDCLLGGVEVEAGVALVSTARRQRRFREPAEAELHARKLFASAVAGRRLGTPATAVGRKFGETVLERRRDASPYQHPLRPLLALEVPGDLV